MTSSQISAMRLDNQQVSAPGFSKVRELVRHLCAMQAQDPLMVRWAIGLRTDKATEASVCDAIDKGEIIRTHLLRPTWHMAAAEDVRWLLELSAPQIKTTMRFMNKKLELTDADFSKSNKVLEKALRNNTHLTREELIPHLVKAKLDVSEYRAGHFFAYAELDGIICSGRIRDNKHTYALLDERLPQTKQLKKDEALGTLALRYFTSHGPATLQDFTWWSGLGVKDAREGLELAKSKLAPDKSGEEILWSGTSSSKQKILKQAYLLASYDEFLISYKNRDASLAVDHQKRTESINGIFWPIAVVNGQVAGLWKRTIKGNKVAVEIKLFARQDAKIIAALEKRAIEFGNFLGKSAEVTFSVK